MGKTNVQNKNSYRQNNKRKKRFLMEKKKKRIKTTTTTTPSRTPELPHEVVLDILSLLPPKVLAKFILVCKRWSDSILNDPEFALRQLRHYSQKNPSYLLFKFEAKMKKYNLNYLSPNVECQFFSIGREGDHRSLGTIKPPYAKRLIGFANGLACLYRQEDRIIEVSNTTRHEILGIFSTQLIDSCRIVCYGFGFDSLTNEYKVVIVYEKFRCMVFMLGLSNSSSWREIQIRDTSLLPRLLTFECKLDSNKYSAIYCEGSLFWKKKCDAPSELLMFDLHKEMFQIIKLPDEYVHPYHLFEHKGSLCVARTGKGENSEKHMCKVHVETLTKEKYDKHKIVWATETFVVKRSSIPWLEETTRTKCALFLSLGNQIFRHWWGYESGSLVLYNAGTKEEKSVLVANGIGSSTHCYSANNHMWNFLSLKTFVQEGVHKIFQSYPSPQDIKELNKREKRSDIAFLFSGSQSQEIRTEFHL